MFRLFLIVASIITGFVAADEFAGYSRQQPQPQAQHREFYSCNSAPRTYCSEDGSRCWLEVDSYVSRHPCPNTPIK